MNDENKKEEEQKVLLWEGYFGDYKRFSEFNGLIHFSIQIFVIIGDLLIMKWFPNYLPIYYFVINSDKII